MPVDLGEYRISVYCHACNEEYGFQSASGQRLDYGQVAMNDVPLGSRISIDGEEFIVTDRAGVPNTVDIFIPSEDGTCHCDTLDYKEVYLMRGE
jgi:3D (Asp-Asp-Asp) domain-containing protein